MKKFLFLLLFILSVQILFADNIFTPIKDFINYKILGKEVVITDTLYLHQGWNWVSFPRLPNLVNNHSNSSELLEPHVPYVYEAKGQWGYMELKLPFGHWDIMGDLFGFRRDVGYKLLLDDNKTSYSLNCEGKLINPYTPIRLRPRARNWIGYFLENSAEPQIAFEDVWDDIKSIKHEYWAKWRKTPTSAWYGYTSVPWVGLRYGEMVVVEIFGSNDLTFEWNPPIGGSREDGDAPVSEYFTYDAKADYIPIQVDLEEDNTTEEVGAFLGDECVGFGKVVDGKAVVLAYIIDEARSGDLEFVLYTGERSPLKKVNEYYTLDYRTNEYKKESIHLESLQENYVVSLTGTEDSVPEIEEVYLTNYPNPFNPSTTISYNVPMAADVTLQIFNAKGQLVKTLVSGTQEQGNYSVTWNGKDNDDKAVSSGIYYSRLETAGKVFNKKMVLMK